MTTPQHKSLWLYVAATLLLWSMPSRTLLGAESPFEIQPASPWVQPLEWTASTERIRSSPQPKNIRYLLYEYQDQAQPAEKFSHIVLRLENAAGVQDVGKLTLTFNPTYQTLIFHKIQIHRDGQTLDKLDPASIKIIQQETELDQNLFTGVKKAVVFLEDLRVGDTLEYTYSLRGEHPLLTNHFTSAFTVQNSMPVDRQRYRILMPQRSPLHLRNHLIDTAPQETVRDGTVEYLWDFGPLPAINVEDALPSAYEPFSYIEASDFADWAAVAEWALPLYAIEETDLPQELQNQITQWTVATSSPEERALLALDFVQNEVRYTGMELGVSAFQPAHPSETFRLRYGDCQGKSSLLCVMLNAMNIPAHPALVDTQLRGQVAEHLPSPFVFNHVIVKLTLGGRVVWVDPTRSHQGGTLFTRYLPDYDRALVVSENTRELEKILWTDPGSSQQLLAVFTLKNYADPVTLEIISTFRGWEADSFRAQMARTETSELEKNYLNYFARRYPGISAIESPKIKDNRRDNVLKTIEKYSIPDFWSRNEAAASWETTIIAENLDNVLPRPDTSLRKMPLGITYPLNREQMITILLPDDNWDLPEIDQTIHNEAFTFRTRRIFTNKTLTFNHSIQTRTQQVTAENIALFLQQRDELQDAISCTLYRSDTPPPVDSSTEAPTEPPFILNWLMVIVALFSAAGTVATCIGFWRLGEKKPPKPVRYRNLQGIGGWLILVAIGLCIAPISLIIQLAQGASGWFSAQVWQATTMPSGNAYHPLFAPLLLFELMANIATLGIIGLTLSLFFARRREFPNVYIFLLICRMAILLIDEMVGAKIPAIAAGVDSKALLQTLVAIMIWCPYMLISKRVKSTFIR